MLGGKGFKFIKYSMLLTILIVSRKLSLLKYLKLTTKMRRETIYYLEFEGTTWITSKTVLN